MTDQDRSNDESLLIEYELDRCSPQERAQAEQLLREDGSARQVQRDVRNTLRALDQLPEYDPPDDLVEKTLARIAQARRTDALLAREEMARRRSRPSFSLREVGAIAAALVLMAAIVVPSAQQARVKSQINQCGSNTGQIGTAIQSYAAANQGQLPSVSARGRWLPGGDAPLAVSNSGSLFHLIRSNYTSPVIFQCPGSDRAACASFAVEAGMNDFPNGRFISYSYQHSVGSDLPSRRTLQDLAGSMAILADDTPVFRNGRFLRERVRAGASDNHRQRGQNVLYLDMHVDWRQQAGAGVRGNNIYLAEGIYEYTGQEAPAGPTDSFLLPAYSGAVCSVEE